MSSNYFWVGLNNNNKNAFLWRNVPRPRLPSYSSSEEPSRCDKWIIGNFSVFSKRLLFETSPTPQNVRVNWWCVHNFQFWKILKKPKILLFCFYLLVRSEEDAVLSHQKAKWKMLQTKETQKRETKKKKKGKRWARKNLLRCPSLFEVGDTEGCKQTSNNELLPKRTLVRQAYKRVQVSIKLYILGICYLKMPKHAYNQNKNLKMVALIPNKFVFLFRKGQLNFNLTNKCWSTREPF